jgi:hypothetical protein
MSENQSASKRARSSPPQLVTACITPIANVTKTPVGSLRMTPGVSSRMTASPSSVHLSHLTTTPIMNSILTNVAGSSATTIASPIAHVRSSSQPRRGEVSVIAKRAIEFGQANANALTSANGSPLLSNLLNAQTVTAPTSPSILTPHSLAGYLQKGEI